jgi:hypothetical protein
VQVCHFAKQLLWFNGGFGARKVGKPIDFYGNITVHWGAPITSDGYCFCTPIKLVAYGKYTEWMLPNSGEPAPAKQRTRASTLRISDGSGENTAIEQLTRGPISPVSTSFRFARVKLFSDRLSGLIVYPQEPGPDDVVSRRCTRSEKDRGERPCASDA